MAYVHAQIIKVLESSNGLAKVEILHRDDGRYEYRAFTWIDADDNQRDPAYWSPIEQSGLYDDAQRAEHDAQRLVAGFAK